MLSITQSFTRPMAARPAQLPNSMPAPGHETTETLVDISHNSRKKLQRSFTKRHRKITMQAALENSSAMTALHTIKKILDEEAAFSKIARITTVSAEPPKAIADTAANGTPRSEPALYIYAKDVGAGHTTQTRTPTLTMEFLPGSVHQSLNLVTAEKLLSLLLRVSHASVSDVKLHGIKQNITELSVRAATDPWELVVSKTPPPEPSTTGEAYDIV